MIKRFLKHKATVGYIILAIGTGVAINGTSNALHDSRERSKVTRGIICAILTNSDEASIRNLPAEAKLLHISLADLQKFESLALKQTASYRAKLAPAVPPGVCSGTPIKLSK